MGDHLSLFDLNKLVKEALDTNLAPSYWVVAEISELRTNQNGHCYLELVEKEDEKVIAKSRATIWAYTYRNLSVWFEGMTGKALQPGLKILCNVNVQYHELYGLSFNIKDIDANFTLGERARKRKEIIDRLLADGVFDMNRSLKLPLVPQNIAVISSPSAAGFGDFLNQLEGNNKGYKFKIRLFKAIMQGDAAQESIVQALHQIFNTADQFDLVCLIRGGGSQIDLDCFDNYELNAHLAQFPLPILTGIGHERDETIADLVAHTKLKTPTAVAEFLINGMRNFEEQLEIQFAHLYQLTNQKLRLLNGELQQLQHYLKSSAGSTLKNKSRDLSRFGELIKYGVRNNLKLYSKQLENKEQHLNLINPLEVLKRGYTLTTLNGKRMHKQKVKEGDIIETLTVSQRLKSEVKEIKQSE